MIESLKNKLRMGVGAAGVTAHLIEKNLQALIDEGRLTREDAEKIARQVAADVQKDAQTINKEMENWFGQMVDRAGIARKDTVEALEKRLHSLETKVGVIQNKE